MARTYTLELSHVTWDWTWTCKDGSGGGSSSSKSGAREAARSACGNSFAISPPDIGATVERGYLATLTVAGLDGDKRTFSAGEISQEVFLFLAGMECAEPHLLKRAEIAVAILKTWGIYRGGVNDETICERHNLSAKQYGRLVRKQFAGLILTVADDGALKWTG